MGIQINGNNDTISALDGSWTAEGAYLNTSGIATATTFKGNVTGTACTFVDGKFTGNVTIGGTLTYEDVTNIDSVGLITARNGIDCNGDLDVDGHTNLDNVSVAGVSTFADRVYFNGRVDLGNATGDIITPNGRFNHYILPYMDNYIHYQLGNSSYRWHRLNIGTGGINISGGGINAVGVVTASAGIDASDAQRNTRVGENAGDSFSGTDATDNTLLGYDAGTAITTGDKNTLVGSYAGDSVSTSANITAIGYYAASTVSTQSVWTGITAVGSNACKTSVGVRNSVVGFDALKTGSSAAYNCIFGNEAARQSDGSSNIVIGDSALLYGTSTASYNIALGRNAFIGHNSNHSSSHSISIGYESLYNSNRTTAWGNVSIGSSSGKTLTTGNNNIIIGNSANSTSATTSNEITLGNSDTTHLRIPGIGVTASSSKLTANNYDLSAIDKSISDTATDIFVYDTRKDSDGGAWRKRTSHTSWYNEGVGATRGARKEFPAVAVIVTEGSAINIYDGDDPEMPLWMQFISGSGQMKIFNRPQYWTSSSVFALNGIICVTNQTGAAESTLVLNYVSDSVRLYPIDGYPTFGGDYSLGISGRANSSGVFKVISQNIYGDEAFDVAMTVLPNAPIDDATGLPIPTIAVAHGHGVSVITDNGEVFDTRATTSGYVPSRKVEFSDSGEYLYIIQDPSLIYSYKTSSFTIDRSSGTLSGYAGISFFSGYVSGSGAAASTKLARSNDLTINIGHANTGLALLYPDYTYTSNSLDNESIKMICRITKDFNSGWMVGDIKGAWLADNDDTNITGSELLSNGTFDTNVTGWTARESGGTFTQSSGQATLAYSSGATSWQTTATVVVGKTYTISFDIVSCTTTSVQAYYDLGSGAVAISVAGTAGKHGHTFVATSTSVTIYPRIFASGNMVVDNFSLREAVDDRSKHNEGLAIHGSITKTAVATGAELVSYGPFSNSNRLRGTYRGTSVYPSVHHYETGDFHIMFWMNNSGTNSHQTLVSRDNREFDVSILDNSSHNRRFRIYALNSSNSLQLMDSNDDPFPLNSWTHVCVNYTNGTTASIYVNGVLNKSGALAYDIDDTTNGVNIGSRNTSGSYSQPADGTKLALVRIAGTAPSPEQIEKIYEDEKKLFAPNAKCTLYGSSDAVTGVAYDDSNDTVHVGTSAGRSDFTGLNRINNTTTAVTTAISASNGLIIEQ